MSSFYDKSSLVLIPSGTNTGKVFSQKPVSGDGDFTFTRASAATRVNADGNIEKETSNLLLQSNQFDTTWSRIGSSLTSGQSGYDGSNEAWLLQALTTTGASIRQSVSKSGVQAYSVYAKAGTANYLGFYNIAGLIPRAWFDLSNGSVGTTLNNIDAKIESVGNGWYKCSLIYDQVLSEVRIYAAASDNTFATSVGDNIYIQDAQLNQGLIAQEVITTTTTALYGGITDNVPRLDYTDSSCPALLLEPLRTNLLNFSEYANSGSSSLATITDNTTTSPEGKQNAARYLPTAQFGRWESDIVGVVPTAGTTYTVSMYFNTNSTLDLVTFYIGWNAATGSDRSGILFNPGTREFISNFTEGAGTVTDKIIGEPDSNGWYRVSIIAIATANTNSDCVLVLRDLSNKADGVKFVDFYGWQMEAGSYATSYIPTYGSSVSRVGETCTDAGTSATFNSTEGVLYAEIAALDNTQSASQYITISDGTYNNRLSILYSNGATNSIRAFLRVGGSSQVDFTSSLTNQKDFNKIAFKYKENDFALWVNGVEVLTDTSGSVSSANTLNDLSFSEIGTSASPFYGKTKEVLVFPTALSDADLEILTGTYYESYSAMAAALNYTVYE